MSLRQWLVWLAWTLPAAAFVLLYLVMGIAALP